MPLIDLEDLLVQIRNRGIDPKGLYVYVPPSESQDDDDEIEE